MHEDTTGSTPAPALWRKSAFSGPQGGDCVEVATTGSGAIAMRNSRDPHGPTLLHTREEMADLLRDIKAGRFDDLAG